MVPWSALLIKTSSKTIRQLLLRSPVLKRELRVSFQRGLSRHNGDRHAIERRIAADLINELVIG